MPRRSFKRSRYVGRTAYRSDRAPSFARVAMKIVEQKRRSALARLRRDASEGMRSCEYVA